MSNSNPAESLFEGHEENEELEHPAYHPSAPPHELFDISTTVDPSHIISLIRKLLPMQNGSHSLESKAHDPSTEGSQTNKRESIFDNEGEQPCVGSQNEAMETPQTYGEAPEVVGECLHHQQKHHDSSIVEATWEEFGCTLWDLAANETHADLMVQNLILEVLLANLMVPHTARVKEICLGIIGNLACHVVSRKQIASKSGLIDIIVDHLFLDDTPCLCEAFRLMTLCFQGGDGVSWIQALRSKHILSRILWITENTLNTQLIEKSVGFLLAIIGSQQEITTVLLPPLVELGLPSLLINLLVLEMSKLTPERISERYSVLDISLQAIEAFSVVDDFSPHVCSNKDLFKLLEDLIKLPDKTEIASSCVTAAVLVANILTDSANLVSKLSQDRYFLQGLFSIFPLASDDIEARTALWSIVARILIFIEQTETSTSTLQQYASVLVSNSNLIEDELLDHQFNDFNEECKSRTTFEAKLSARTKALKAIVDILSHWKILKPHHTEITPSLENHVNEEDVDVLLDCCCKYIK